MTRTSGNNKSKEKEPAKGKATSPSKSDSPSPMAVTPSRGRVLAGLRTMEAMKNDRPRPAAWYLTASLLDGQLAYFTVSAADPGNDGYSQTIVEALALKEHPLRDEGLFASLYMSQGRNGAPLRNKKNDYMRKCFVILMKPEEHNSETLLSKLEVVKKFLELPENNRFGTKVVLNDPEHEWDLTPPMDQPLPRLQDVVQYKEILKAIGMLFASVDRHWCENNEEAAWAYFHEGHVPLEAAANLGFPLDKVMTEKTPKYNFGGKSG